MNSKIIVLHQWLEGSPKYISQDLISYINKYFSIKDANYNLLRIYAKNFDILRMAMGLSSITYAN